MKTISLDAEYNFNWIKNQIKWIEYNYRYLFKNIQQRKHELYDIILIEISRIFIFIETSIIITAYSHSQQTHSQDVRKDVRYQSISQSIDQSISVNQISQSVDHASVTQTSLRQAFLQSLNSHLSYNSLYAAINQFYHFYNQSLYYAFFESPRLSYVINQSRFISQASQSNLSQSIQSSASQSSQSSQSSSLPSAHASQSVPESVHVNQSYDSNQEDFFRQLPLLNKIYKKNEKFSDTSSNFDFKVLKFYDKCRRARLSEHAYLQSVSIMLSNEALDYFYSNLQFCYSFHDFCVNIKHYFENSKWYRINLTRWQIINISEIVAVNSNLFLLECLRKMCFEMSTIQKDLNSAFVDSIQLRKNIIRVCRDHFALISELNNASINVSDLINALHTNVMNYEAIRKQHDSMQQTYLNDLTQQTHLLNQNQIESENQYFIDRQYRRDESSFNRREDYRDKNDRFQNNRRLKKCFVCEKLDCWSINHFEKERKNSKKRFSDRHLEYKIRQRFDRRLNQYIADFESTYDSDDEYAAQFFDELAISLEIDIIKLIEFESDELFLTSFDEFRDIESLTSALADKTFQHRLISTDIINSLINESFNYISITDSRYDDSEFKRILVNCDAADRSIEDMSQFKALQRISNVALNKKTIESSIKFEIDNTLILESVELNISLEVITFHIMRMNIWFLLCLNDFDRLGIYFNNLINQIIQYEHTSIKRRHPVIRRYEHAFLLWKLLIQSLILEFIEKNSCLLIEIELRRLHRRFGHFSARRLHEILHRSEHNKIEWHAIKHLIKFCHHCQMHDKFLGRFIFSIRDEDIQFNYSIVVDILYMKRKSADNNKSILHIVNETIRFQASRWLKEISARHVWDQLRVSWIDIYLRSSDLITADADKQFVTKEFKQYADNIKITVKTILVETHHSIEMMKRYHDSLRRMYAIITTEISSIDLEITLQMTFKIINDSIELDELISSC